jgi:hypothetical protein
MSEQSDLQRDLGRVEGKLDSVINMLTENGKKHTDLEERVRKVEGRQLYWSGASFAAAFILAKVDFTKLIAAATAAGMH